MLASLIGFRLKLFMLATEILTVMGISTPKSSFRLKLFMLATEM